MPISHESHSITQGWEGAGREVWERYYAPRHALNLGIGGRATTTMDGSEVTIPWSAKRNSEQPAPPIAS